nr:hypothetical protein [uncultured Bdellovibrio sp.]
MKSFIVFTMLLTSFQIQAAPAKYCKARKKTAQKIEQMRIVDLPFKAVQNEVVKALISDKCVRSRLDDEEILTLSEMLLSPEYTEDSANQIIGEFLAQ